MKTTFTRPGGFRKLLPPGWKTNPTVVNCFRLQAFQPNNPAFWNISGKPTPISSLPAHTIAKELAIFPLDWLTYISTEMDPRNRIELRRIHQMLLQLSHYGLPPEFIHAQQIQEIPL